MPNEKNYNINAIYRAIGSENMVKANKQIAASFSEIHQMGKKTVAISGYVDTVGNRMATTMRIAEDHRQRFKMYYLSIMFGGMQIQRTFGKIEQSTISTFMKITEGQTTAGQAITALSANWEYLKFSIGDAIATALEPLLPIILEIVQGFADFVQQNPELTFIAISGAITAGGFLFAIGQVGLFMQGLSMWKGSPEFSDLPTKMANIAGAAFKLIGTAFIIKGAFEFGKQLVTGEINVADLAKALTEIAGGALLFVPHPAAKAIGVTLILMAELGIASEMAEQIQDLLKYLDDKLMGPLKNMFDGLKTWLIQRGMGWMVGVSEPTLVAAFGMIPTAQQVATTPVTQFKPGVYGDFISRPGMPPIQFSPDDTIFGTKTKVELPKIEIPEFPKLEVQTPKLEMPTPEFKLPELPNLSVQLPKLEPFPQEAKTENTITINFDVVVNNPSSNIDIKQALSDYKDELMSSLKAYGIGG